MIDENSFIISLPSQAFPRSFVEKKVQTKKRTPYPIKMTLESLENRLNPAAANISLLTEGLVHSTEYYRNQAQVTYQQILGRESDTPGLNGWVRALRDQGLTTQDMVSRFVGSDEFINNNKHDANLMVGFLYQNLLGRKPDAAGLQDWVQSLDNLSTFYYSGKTKDFSKFKATDTYGTAKDLNFVGLAPQNRTPSQTAALKSALKTIANSFAYEPETLKGTIQSYYTGVLGRGASQKEINGWYNYYQNGVRNEDLLKQFIGSKEYQAKFVNTQQLIMGVYEDILFRQADVQGFKAWSTVLDPKTAKDHKWVSQLPDITNLPQNTTLTDSQLEKVLANSYANLVKKNGLETIPYLAQNDPSFMLKSMKDRVIATLPVDQQQTTNFTDDKKIWDLIGAGKWDTTTGQWVFDPTQDNPQSITTLEYHRPTNAVIVVKPGSNQVDINSNPNINPWNGTAEEYQNWLEQFQQSCWQELPDDGGSSQGKVNFIDPNKNILDWKYDFESGLLIPIYGNEGNNGWEGGNITAKPIPPALTNWAYADFNGDGIPDLVNSNQPWAQHQVEILNGNGGDQVLVGFDPYPGFVGAISIAIGDIDGDGNPEILTGSGPGIDANIQAWSIFTTAKPPAIPMKQPGEENSFPPLDPPVDPPAEPLTATLAKVIATIPGNQDGVTLSTGDFNGDGISEVLVGTWAGKTPGLITIYDPAQPADVKPIVFAPFGSDSSQDITYLTTGDFNGDGQLDIGVNSSGSWETNWFDGQSLKPIQAPTYDPGQTDPNPDSSFFQFASADLNQDGIPDWIYAKDAAGEGDQVKIISGETGNLLVSFKPYPDFHGQVTVATADIDGDGIKELITGTGPGTSISIKAWSISPSEMAPQYITKGGEWPRPEPTCMATFVKDIINIPDKSDGLVLAAGDLNGDKIDEILLGSWAGNPALVTIIDPSQPSDSTPIVFSPFGKDSTQDISWLGVMDVNCDGQLDIGVNATGMDNTRWFDGKTLEPVDFQVINPGPISPSPDPSFSQFASADFNLDGIPDWVDSSRSSDGDQVKIFSGSTGEPLFSFNPFPEFTGIVTIAVGDINGDGKPELVTGTGPGTDVTIKAWSIDEVNSPLLMKPNQGFFTDPGHQTFEANLLNDIISIPGNTDGVVLATGDLNGDKTDEVLVGSWPGLPGLITIYDLTQTADTKPVELVPYPEDKTGSISWLGTADINQDGQLDIGVASGSFRDVRWFDGKTLEQIDLPSIDPTPVDPYPESKYFQVTSADVNHDGLTDWIYSNLNGTKNQITVYSGDGSGSVLLSFDPYPGWTGLVTVTTGDILGDGNQELITGTGPGGEASINAWSFVLDDQGNLTASLAQKIAIIPEMTTGVIVASGDLNGDGKSEILVGTWTGIPAKVWIYDLSQVAGSDPVSFSPFPNAPDQDLAWLATNDVNNDGQIDIGISSTDGNDSVWFDGKTLKPVNFSSIDPIIPQPEPIHIPFYWASGDLNGDGFTDWVITHRPGSANQLEVFVPTDNSAEFFHFDPYPGFDGSIPVAIGDIDGDGKVEIITSTGPGPGLDIKAWTVDGKLVKNILNLPDKKDGALIASADLNGDGQAEIILGTWAGISPKISIYDLKNGAESAPLDFVPFADPDETISYLTTEDINEDGQTDIGVISDRGEESWFDGKTLAKIQNPGENDK